MSDIKDPTSLFPRVMDAYLYNEIYKRGLIKSKSFNPSTSKDDIRSKILFILKSIVISTIKDNDLTSIFTNVTFSKALLQIDWSPNQTTLEGRIMSSYVKTYIQNGQCNYATIGNNSIQFNFGDAKAIYGNSNKILDCRERLNKIINDIVFTKSLILDCGIFIKKIKSKGFDELSTFEYLKYCPNFLLFGPSKRIAMENLERLFAHPNILDIDNEKIKFTDDKLDIFAKDLFDFIDALTNKYFPKEDIETIPKIDSSIILDPDQKFIVVGGAVVKLND